MKQETLEEAAERHTYGNAYQNFIRGAKWQQERMYSEEEVLEILYKHTEDLLSGKKVTLEQWFKQFKNK